MSDFDWSPKDKRTFDIPVGDSKKKVEFYFYKRYDSIGYTIRVYPNPFGGTSFLYDDYVFFLTEGREYAINKDMEVFTVTNFLHKGGVMIEPTTFTKKFYYKDIESYTYFASQSIMDLIEMNYGSMFLSIYKFVLSHRGEIFDLVSEMKIFNFTSVSVEDDEINLYKFDKEYPSEFYGESFDEDISNYVGFELNGIMYAIDSMMRLYAVSILYIQEIQRFNLISDIGEVIDAEGDFEEIEDHFKYISGADDALMEELDISTEEKEVNKVLAVLCKKRKLLFNDETDESEDSDQLNVPKVIDFRNDYWRKGLVFNWIDNTSKLKGFYVYCTSLRFHDENGVITLDAVDEEDCIAISITGTDDDTNKSLKEFYLGMFNDELQFDFAVQPKYTHKDGDLYSVEFTMLFSSDVIEYGQYELTMFNTKKKTVMSMQEFFKTYKANIMSYCNE